MAAGIRIEMDSNAKEVSAQLRSILKDNERITAQALNFAARWARTQTVRELASRLNVTQKPLRKRIQFFKARKGTLRAALWVGLKKAIGAEEISGQVGRSKTGHVKIGKRVFKKAFLAEMPTGHRGIFIRKPGARHKQRPDGQWTQLPIEEGVQSLWPDAETVSREFAEKAFRDVYPKEARRLLDVKLQSVR